MRKLIVSTQLTLDGVMQAPGGPEEDTTGGFAHGGWSFHYWDEETSTFMGKWMGSTFDLVLGRRTYEIFASYWPHQDHDPAKQLNDATKHVASRTLKSVDWQNSHLIEGDVAEGISALKRQDGPELLVLGSGDLIQTLLRHSLVDEFRLIIVPAVIGEGKRLFADGTVPAGLKLTEGHITSNGVMIATYQPAGELVTGSFVD